MVTQLAEAHENWHAHKLRKRPEAFNNKPSPKPWPQLTAPVILQVLQSQSIHDWRQNLRKSQDWLCLGFTLSQPGFRQKVSMSPSLGVFRALIIKEG